MEFFSKWLKIVKYLVLGTLPSITHSFIVMQKLVQVLRLFYYGCPLDNQVLPFSLPNRKFGCLKYGSKTTKK